LKREREFFFCNIKFNTRHIKRGGGRGRYSSVIFLIYPQKLVGGRYLLGNTCMMGSDLWG
jgi:hypothetical protein